MLKLYFRLSDYFDGAGEHCNGNVIDSSYLIPNTHQYLFDFLTCDLTKLDIVLNKYFEVFNVENLQVEDFDKKKSAKKVFNALKKVHMYYAYLAEATFDFNEYVKIKLNHLLSEAKCKNIEYKKYIEILEDLCWYDFKLYGDEFKEACFNDFHSNYNTEFDGVFTDLITLQVELKRITYWIFDLSVNDLSHLSFSQRASLYDKLFIGTDSSLVQITKDISFGNRTSNRNSALFDFCEDRADVSLAINNLHDTNNDLPKEIKPFFDDLLSSNEEPINEVCQIDDLRQLLMLEIISLLENPVLIKKCKLCGNYFVAENLKNEYCTNIAKGETRPCFEIGPTKVYQSKMKNDESYVLYQRAYKTHYARLMKRKISQNQFNIWSLEAKNRLELVRNGKMDILVFSEWLKI